MAQDEGEATAQPELVAQSEQVESARPGEAKKWRWKRPFAVLFALIGVIASTSTVIALVKGWIDPTVGLGDIAEQQQRIEQTLQAKAEDGELVNQVSRRVTQLSDQFRQIESNLNDIRRLHGSLEGSDSAGRIMTPAQARLLEASRRQETTELLALLTTTEAMAIELIESTRRDETLARVSTTESRSGETRQRALDQAEKIEREVLPELRRLKAAHE